MKKTYLNFQGFYGNHFLRPHFKSLGKGFTFVKPWYIEIFGSPIELGDYIHIIASADRRVRLSAWSDPTGGGRIRIRDYSLICPGVRISSASQIAIGNSCMLASNVYITDSDWHDTYDRLALGKASPIRIEDNVWIGDSAIICKGVTVGENSIIGAGAVVTKSVPSNAIAAGNPARVVKTLDPATKITARDQWFADPGRLSEDMDRLDREILGGNTLFHWLRYLLFPLKKDYPFRLRDVYFHLLWLLLFRFGNFDRENTLFILRSDCFRLNGIAQGK